MTEQQELAEVMADAYHHHRTGLRGFGAMTTPRINDSTWSVLAGGVERLAVRILTTFAARVLPDLVDAAVEARLDATARPEKRLAATDLRPSKEETT